MEMPKEVKTIQIPVSGGTCASEVFLRNGFAKVNAETNFDKLQPLGLFSWTQATKDGKIYVFRGWESNEYGLMADKPKYITAVDVTDILTAL